MCQNNQFTQEYMVQDNLCVIQASVIQELYHVMKELMENMEC